MKVTSKFLPIVNIREWTNANIMRGSENRETLPQRAQIGKLFPDGISTYSEKYSPLDVLEKEQWSAQQQKYLVIKKQHFCNIS